MSHSIPDCAASAICPDGTTIFRRDLPKPNTKRWVARRKAAVVNAVNAGLISAEQACDAYDLSMEELDGWRDAVDKYGVLALRTTSLQHYKTT